MTEDEISYIQGLGILDEKEKIILFDSQMDIKTSGNFISDKRLASYWIDKRDKRKNEVNFVYYKDIDTITYKDLSKSLTYASFLEAVKKDGKKMKVYVGGDNNAIRYFYKVANRELKKNF